MMKRFVRNSRRNTMVPILLLVAIGATDVWAQSSTRRPRVVNRVQPPAQPAVPKQDAAKLKVVPKPAKAEAQPLPPLVEEKPAITIDKATLGKFQQPRPELAAEGFDVVALTGTGSLVNGNPQFEEFFDGQTFRFSTSDNQLSFKEAPANFAPVMGGLSVVAFRDRWESVPGSARQFSSYGNRIYLFTNPDEKAKFDASPGRYFDADVLLDGFSPVSLVDEEVLRRGDKEFLVTYNGHRVYLSSIDEKELFEADPGKYYPTLGGLDPVAMVKETPAVGVARFSAVYKNRLYMMSSEENRNEFVANPLPYADLDVAFEGNCPVTRIDNNETVPGHYGISVINRGRRILFVDESKQRRFLEEPRRYDSWPETPTETPVPPT